MSPPATVNEVATWIVSLRGPAYTAGALVIAVGHAYQLMRLAKHGKLAVGWSLVAIALCASATIIVDAL